MTKTDARGAVRRILFCARQALRIAVAGHQLPAAQPHQLPRDPLHLFDANIFHPERNTLAFSEHMLPQALMGAPLLWLGRYAQLVKDVATGRRGRCLPRR